MKKLIIQIPCLNEEKTLPLVLKDIPKSIVGIDIIETLIVDDGSTDNTIKVAENLGVTHIIKNISNKGLGNAFRIGMEHALQQNADILVNTDGDNQYPSHYIADLVRPIINQEADIVIGNRQTDKIQHFSPVKKFFQWLGTNITKSLAGEMNVTDAVSGFRAYSRQALLEINVTSNFSYVLDTTLQAARKRLKLVSIDIITNEPTRPSRLFTNIFQHIRKSGMDLIRIYSMYQPLRVFFWLGVFTFIIGLIPIGRFLYHYFFVNNGEGMIQSLIFGSIFIIISTNLFALGIIGDLLARNRILIEHTLKNIKKDQLKDEEKTSNH